MKIVADEPLKVNVIVTRIAGVLKATFIAKLGFSSSADARSPVLETNELTGDVFADMTRRKELLYPSDFVPFKPRADVMLICPGFKAEATTEVRLNFPGINKKVVALPGTRNGLVWSSAYGGESFPLNPEGKGADDVQVPTIVNPRDIQSGNHDLLQPAGFAPIPQHWPYRLRQCGSYTRDYRRAHWPWFPPDFDFSYFQSAPEDQQVEGFLHGGEIAIIENAGSHFRNIEVNVPAIRVQCFCFRRAHGELGCEEIALNIDTLWMNLDTEKGVLVSRGLVNVQSLKLREIEYVLFVLEKAASPRMTVAEATLELRRRITPPTTETDAADEAPADAVLVDRELEEMEAQLEAEGLAAEHQVEDLLQQALDQMRNQAGGADALIVQGKVQELNDGIQQLEAELEGIRQSNPEQALEMEAALEQVKAAQAEVAVLNEEISSIDAEFSALFPPSITVAQVKEGLEDKKNFDSMSFDELDLSGFDFTGRKLRGCSFRRAKLSNCSFRDCDLAFSDFSDAELVGADFRQANLDDAVFNSSKLTNAVFAEASLNRAVFAKQSLLKSDFSACRGRNAEFSGADLTGSNFMGANLPQADFSLTNLTRVRFSGAVLTAARFTGCNGQWIQLDHANITAIHGSGDFCFGTFRKVEAEKATFERAKLDDADFTGSNLHRASFSEASVCRSRFVSCSMAKAVFDDANLEEADFGRSDLRKATFDRALMTRTNLRATNLYGSGFWETVFDSTDAEGANLRGTVLEHR